MKRFSLPLEFVAPSIFLFVLPFTHTTPLRLVCLALSIVSVALSLKRHVPLILPEKVVLAAIAFWVFISTIACFTSVDPSYSWGEYRNEVAWTLIAFCIFYFLTDSENAWRTWSTVLFASFCAISLLAIFSYQRDNDWLRSSFVGDRNAYSTYVVLIFPFLLFLLTRTIGKPGWRLPALAGALLLALISGAFTQNRNLWFAIACECISFAAFFWFRQSVDVRRRLLRRYLLAAGAGAIVFPCILVYVVHEKARHSNTSAESQARFDQDPRIGIWAYAAEHIRRRPWTGYGYGRGILRKDFREHFDNPLKWHGHNIVVNYALEAGIPGAAAIIGLFAALYAQSWSIYRNAAADIWPYGAWALAMLIGITIKMMTDDILVRDGALLFWSMVGMIFGLCLRRSKLQPSRADASPDDE